MSAVVPFPRPSHLRVVPGSGTRFGAILREIDGIPGCLASGLDRLSGADLAVVADALEHNARRVRALAECCTGGEPR